MQEGVGYGPAGPKRARADYADANLTHGNFLCWAEV